MESPVLYRIVLLGLLPFVALLIYIEGQQYDPAIIRFESSQTEEINMNDFFPRNVKGFNRSGQIRYFAKDNLFEYVNGQAEFFISYGFISLAVGEYVSVNHPDNEPEVTVDIYDMGKSLHAFGILSDESGNNLSDIHTGITGFKTPLGLSYARGQYYIKISSYNKNIDLDVFTESITDKLGEGSDPFPEFSRLPDIGDVVSTRYIKEGYRGLDFVNNVLEREYNIDGKPAQVFVVTGNEKEINNLAGLFIDYFKESEINYTRTDKEGKRVYRINDPYEGDWVLIHLTDKLLGMFGSPDDTVINSILAVSG
jgi:hypothetical protein